MAARMSRSLWTEIMAGISPLSSGRRASYVSLNSGSASVLSFAAASLRFS